MYLIVLACSLLLVTTGQQDDEWIDPYDMLNYDSSTKSMRNPPAEPANYPNVPTKRREYTQDSNQAHLEACNKQVVDLQRQIEEQKKKITLISQQPICNPVFRRLLIRLLKKMERLGLPSDSSDAIYDAKVRVSRQAVTEIQAFLEGGDSWRTGALDSAISQVLVELKPHDQEAWKWRFEDTFGVELDTVIKVAVCVLILVAIICTQLWSTVSWFVQFWRLFAICFFISIVWNWLYLYKIAFAEHQNNMVKMDSVNEKCTGVKKIDWSDSLKEWFRGTWTLQDDPCKRYYEVLMVNPILLVPPTKAISVTITTFITEPLKHFGQGISEFLRALLKDLPVTLQIPVLLTIVISIVVFLYGGVQAAFQYGITAPLRRHQRGPRPPPVEQQQPPIQRITNHEHFAGGDASQDDARHRGGDGRACRNQVHQRRPNRAREEPGRVFVETLRTADRPHSEDETNDERGEGGRDTEWTESLSANDSDSQSESESEQQETQEEQAGGGGDGANVLQAKAKPSQSNPDSCQAKTKPVKGNKSLSEDEVSRDSAASRSQPHNKQSESPAGKQPSQTPTASDVQVQEVLAGDRPSSVSGDHVETIGFPVQETTSTS
ncbi:hypothetical protein LDENG_00126960 [Lucifuga dentata]|nr:hypothetical protein LDENG_00126960 [Lucifuga dentata]